MDKNDLKWPQMRPGSFCPTNQDLADILGDTYLIVQFFLMLLDPRFPDIPGFPDSWILESGSWLWLAVAWGVTGRRIWRALPDHRIQQIQGTSTIS